MSKFDEASYKKMMELFNPEELKRMQKADEEIKKLFEHPCPECGATIPNKLIEDSYLHHVPIGQCPECGYYGMI